jgi:hypothetical protein
VSHAVLCDQCDSMLRVDVRGDDVHGERAAWIRLVIAGDEYEVCTTSCAIQFLQRDDVAGVLADQLEAVSASTIDPGRTSEMSDG